MKKKTASIAGSSIIAMNYCLHFPYYIGNTRRRSKILSSWKFECQCLRCQDVTEFGTNYDAIKCQKCPEGLVLPEKALSINSDWKCSGCEFKVYLFM